MIPKFRFYDPIEFPGMYRVVALRLDDDNVIVEDDKNTSMLEVVEGDYHTSVKGYPTYVYGFDEGVLMQSTGQKDMDGIEIYEGDIVSYFIGGIDVKSENDFLELNVNAHFDDYYVNEVIFTQGYFGVKAPGTIYPLWGSEKNVKVLGNKYENPELLESYTL